MFYVEEENFLEDLKNKKYIQLNEEGIEKVVNELIKELQEDMDVLTSADDNDSVWNEEENM